MTAAMIVTVVIILVAVVGWPLLTRPESQQLRPETTAQTFAPAPAATIDASGNETAITLVSLPSEFHREVTVKSRSEKGKTYAVNLGQLTCSCPDFEKRRASLPANDIRRVCKHIGRALEDADALSHYDEIAQAFIRPKKASGDRSVGHGVNAARFVRLQDGADELALSFSLDNAWVDVVTRRGTKSRIKKYKRYSYNVDERRWSYGSAPFSDGEIRHAITTHFRG
jgi:hypothetical protein